MKALKLYLCDSDITQVEFAELMGVAQPTVSSWLRGDFMPTIERLKEMSVKTGLTINQLLDIDPWTARSPQSAA